MLLIDADILCYRVGYSCNNDTEENALKTLDSFISEILTSPLHSATEYKLFLSGKGNFREQIAVTAPYKGNRKSDKPVHYTALRNHMLLKWEADLSIGEEADDTIAIKATALYPDAIIASIDKDFLQVPGKHYNFVKDTLITVTQEEATLTFYCSILIGDRIDNIIGAAGIGAVKSKALLEGKTEVEMYNACVEILGADRVLENARLLWLRREAGQMWEPPVLVVENANG
jgi:hypothetical protein